MSACRPELMDQIVSHLPICSLLALKLSSRWLALMASPDKSLASLVKRISGDKKLRIRYACLLARQPQEYEKRWASSEACWWPCRACLLFHPSSWFDEVSLFMSRRAEARTNASRVYKAQLHAPSGRRECRKVKIYPCIDENGERVLMTFTRYRCIVNAVKTQGKSLVRPEVGQRDRFSNEECFDILPPYTSPTFQRLTSSYLSVLWVREKAEGFPARRADEPRLKHRTVLRVSSALATTGPPFP